MTVRIERTSEDSKVVLCVAGRLEGEGVRELISTCGTIVGEFVLDLAGLNSADPEGIKAIRTLARGGAGLRRVSPFIRLLLDDQPPAKAK